MKLIASFLLAACAVLLTSGFADAAKVPSVKKQEQYQEELFRRLDGNNDGKVTEREYVVGILYALFVEHDTDGDGKISEQEYARGSKKELTPAQAAKEYAIMDREKKGYFEFKDLFRNDYAIDDLREEWAKLMKELGKKPSDHITKADLPDIDPNS